MGRTKRAFYTLNLERIPRIFELDFESSGYDPSISRRWALQDRKAVNRGDPTTDVCGKKAERSVASMIECTCTRASNAAERIRIYFTLVQRDVQVQNYALRIMGFEFYSQMITSESEVFRP